VAFQPVDRARRRRVDLLASTPRTAVFRALRRRSKMGIRIVLRPMGYPSHGAFLPRGRLDNKPGVSQNEKFPIAPLPSRPLRGRAAERWNPAGFAFGPLSQNHWSTFPESTVPGLSFPGSRVPGSRVPGSRVPGSRVPGCAPFGCAFYFYCARCLAGDELKLLDG
jgi:hypothetical protein